MMYQVPGRQQENYIRSTLLGTCRAKIFNKTIDTGDVVKSEALTLTKHRSGFSTFK